MIEQKTKLIEKVEPVIRIITVRDDQVSASIGYTLSGKVVVLAVWFPVDRQDADGNWYEDVRPAVQHEPKDDQVF